MSADSTSSYMPNNIQTPSSTSSNNINSNNISSFDKAVNKGKNFLKTDKGTASILIGILVTLSIFVFAHEKTYEITNRYLSPYLGKLVDDDKTPSNTGMLLHSALGGLIVGLVIYFAFDQFLVSWKKQLE
jgi:hypothetical protein